MISIYNNTIENKMMPDEKTRKVLSQAGARVTNQRALILRIIRQAQGHLDADEIYRRARNRKSRISLSTVYRTLSALKRMGLIEELHFDNSHHHYEIKPATEHHHLLCLGCGRVIEFRYPLSQYIKRGVTEAKDFEIIDTEIRITGYCSKCRHGRD